MSQELLGKALLDYHKGAYSEDITTYLHIGGLIEKDSLPLPYLFRNFEEMPRLEQKALQLSRGKILDIGAGAGSHALFLQTINKDVTALDISKGAVDVCIARGVKKTIASDIFAIKDQKFDTLLALMNGSGLAGKLSNLGAFLKHLSSLLETGGQILLDSSDIIYMYEDEEGDHWIPSDLDYYGEVRFQMEYKNKKEPLFDWLYVDYNTLQRCANDNGLYCELIAQGNHYDFLARLTLAP